MNNPCRHSPSARTRSGFSLVEMLVVLAVIGALVTFAIPGFIEIAKGSRLKQATDVLRNNIVYAQQLAVKDNKNIVLHFYRYDDRMTPGAEREFRAFQILERPAEIVAGGKTGEGSSAARREDFPEITPPIRLPEGIVISDQSEYSTILSNQFNGDNQLATWQRLPRSLTDSGSAEVFFFEFRPDGSTSLPKDGRKSMHITLYDEAKGLQASGLPNNFVTLQIDPYSGNVQQYQP